MLALHHECDPTIPVIVAWGDLRMGRYFQENEGKLGRQVFRWLCIAPDQQGVDGSQVALGCCGVRMLLLSCVIETALRLIFQTLMGGACV